MTSQEPPGGGAERRRYSRKLHECPVRFATAREADAIGDIVDISESGLYMRCETTAGVGDYLIAYPEKLGRLVGKISRKDHGGVAVEFLMSETKRAFFSKQLDAVLAERPLLKIMERRASVRTKLSLEAAAVMEGESETFACRIVELSEDGAAVETDRVPPLGVRVRIGVLHGVVARHTPAGFALAFLSQKPE